MTAPLRRTKIVTTLGPATDKEGVLEKIIIAGANVVRMNFSHAQPKTILNARIKSALSPLNSANTWVFLVTCRARKSAFPPLPMGKSNWPLVTALFSMPIYPLEKAIKSASVLITKTCQMMSSLKISFCWMMAVCS